MKKVFCVGRFNRATKKYEMIMDPFPRQELKQIVVRMHEQNKTISTPMTFETKKKALTFIRKMEKELGFDYFPFEIELKEEYRVANPKEIH